jgi:hypothetical protein
MLTGLRMVTLSLGTSSKILLDGFAPEWLLPLCTATMLLSFPKRSLRARRRPIQMKRIQIEHLCSVWVDSKLQSPLYAGKIELATSPMLW